MYQAKFCITFYLLKKTAIIAVLALRWRGASSNDLKTCLAFFICCCFSNDFKTCPAFFIYCCFMSWAERSLTFLHKCGDKYRALFGDMKESLGEYTSNQPSRVRRSKTLILAADLLFKRLENQRRQRKLYVRLLRRRTCLYKFLAWNQCVWNRMIFFSPPPFPQIKVHHTVNTRHKVGRVLSFFSSRRNWDSPNPSPAGECVPPPGSGGRG